MSNLGSSDFTKRYTFKGLSQEELLDKCGDVCGRVVKRKSEDSKGNVRVSRFRVYEARLDFDNPYTIIVLGESLKKKPKTTRRV